ncbi:hypothetical protein BN2537_2395 [Streptomyces venezuelae]|nr:hypothetical protein BN2537_2395 [Streptomyces venezuelae]
MNLADDIQQIVATDRRGPQEVADGLRFVAQGRDGRGLGRSGNSVWLWGR